MRPRMQHSDWFEMSHNDSLYYCDKNQPRYCYCLSAFLVFQQIQFLNVTLAICAWLAIAHVIDFTDTFIGISVLNDRICMISFDHAMSIIL